MSDDKKPQDKDVKDLTPAEMGSESVTIRERMKALLTDIRRSSNLPKGQTDEELIKFLTAKSGRLTASGGLMLPTWITDHEHPTERKAETQVKEGDKYAIKKLGDLADEYAKLEQRAKAVDERLKGNPSAADEAKAAADKAKKPPVTSNDPISKFQPQFLNDNEIEDLARTGQFDITPQSIAAMFPSAELQTAQAQAKQQGLPSPETVFDKLAPDQYKDPSFVHSGKNFPFQSDPQQLAVQRVKDQGLPAWEEAALINQLQGSQPMAGMTRDAYDQKRQAILDAKLPWHEEIKQLNALKAQFDAGAADMTVRKPTTQTSRATGPATNIITGAGNPAAGNASLREVVQKPYGWTGDQVSATAVELFKAGYLQISNYDPTKALSQQMHITSAFDPDFQKAYLAWVSDSFKDRSKSMMDILQDRKDSFLPQLKQLADRIEAAKPKLTIQLADAQGIRKTAETLSQQVVGHTLADDDYQQLISYIHGLQTNQQTAAYQQQYGPGATGGTTEDVDVNARLEAAIRANHPAEAGAKDVADEADLMRSLFAGPV